MTTFTLTQSELLVLADALRAEAVIGIDLPALRPTGRDELRAILAEGHARLERRGLLHRDGAMLALDSTLLVIGAAAAFPQFAAITTRKPAGRTREVFVHYLTDGLLVEHSFPDPGTHRLALLPPQKTFIGRVEELLPIPAAAKAGPSFLVTSGAFGLCIALAQRGRDEDARTILDPEGAQPEAAGELLAALARPALGGTVALLRCRGDQVDDGRNPALIVGDASSWLVSQVLPGSPLFAVERVSADLFGQRLYAWYVELAPARRAAPAPAAATLSTTR